MSPISFSKDPRITGAVSANASPASGKPGVSAASQPPIRNLAEACLLIEPVVSAIDSATQLLDDIKSLVIRSADLTLEVEKIQNDIEGHLSEIDHLLETPVYKGRRIFAGELSNTKAIIGLPAVVVDIAVPKVNRVVLGLGNSIDIGATVERLSLSRDPENPENVAFDKMAPAFRCGLAKYFNSYLSHPAPIQEGTTAQELADLVNTENSDSNGQGLPGSAIDYYFGGRFDPAAHVPQLNNLTTTTRLLANIANAQDFFWKLRARIDASLAKLEIIDQAGKADQDVTGKISDIDAAKEMMKSISMGVLESAAMNMLSQANTKPGSDVKDLLR